MPYLLLNKMHIMNYLNYASNASYLAIVCINSIFMIPKPHHSLPIAQSLLKNYEFVINMVYLQDDS